MQDAAERARDLGEITKLRIEGGDFEGLGFCEEEVAPRDGRLHWITALREGSRGRAVVVEKLERWEVVEEVEGKRRGGAAAKDDIGGGFKMRVGSVIVK